MKLWLLISLPLYILDQLTKWLVLAHISTDELIPVIPGFLNLVQVHNTGAAFGMLRDNNLFFVILSFSALSILAILAWKGVFQDWTSRWAGALLVAGVAGNLTDRILHGHVVDFLDVILPWYGRWPAFNVADSCICIAAGLFILGSFLDGKRRKAQPSLP
ncbi:MAG: signal peptidase II [Terrimicrobiaceae bacterium]